MRSLALASFLCALVAGFLFAFAAVVMPGIGSLDDGRFIRAFQVIDRVIQRNQPLFVLVWVGSVPALIAAAALGIWALSGADGRWLLDRIHPGRVHFDLEGGVGAPSRWNTLRALRVLDWWDRGARAAT